MASTEVFLSSTTKDLHEYRGAVALAVEKLDGFNCVRMEAFGARDIRVGGFLQSTGKRNAMFTSGLLATVMAQSSQIRASRTPN